MTALYKYISKYLFLKKTKNFKSNSRIWHYFQQLAKFLEKSLIKLYSSDTKSKFRIVKISNQFSDFVRRI